MASESATAAPTSCAPAAGVAVVADSGDAPAAAAAAPVPAPAAIGECYRCGNTTRVCPLRKREWADGRAPWLLCGYPWTCFLDVAEALAMGWHPDHFAGWADLTFPHLAKWLVFECAGELHVAWIDPMTMLSMTHVKGLSGQDPAWVACAIRDYQSAMNAMDERGRFLLSASFDVPRTLHQA